MSNTIINSNDAISDDYSLGGTFIFGNEAFTSCNISSNGFIFFRQTNNIFTYNPFSDLTWKTIAPFAGDLETTTSGVILITTNNICTITFNCYSAFNVKTNILKFAIDLYLNDHITRPNEVDFRYVSSQSQTESFKNNYYIGYCDGNMQKYLSDVGSVSNISYGGLNITSSNVFPASGFIIRNITHIIPPKILCNASTGVAYNIALGGDFVYGSNTYTTCNISSSGFIYFENLDTGPNDKTTNIFSNSTWKIIAPFSGAITTTSDGVSVIAELHMLTITYNCYSQQNSVANILVYSIVLYLSNHPDRPNQVDFKYISSTSTNTDFRNNYYIGYCDGKISKSVLNCADNIMTITIGSLAVQSYKKFPTNGTILRDITNYAPTISTYLALRYDATTRNVNLGGIFKFGETYYDTCNISSNGYIYFDLDVKTVKEPDSTSSNPFVDKGWKIIAPFCGKLRVTPFGILRQTDEIEKKCTITFNCYASSNSNSRILSFATVLYFDTNLFRANQIDFIYISQEKLFNKGNLYYIGYSDGSIQKYLKLNTDIVLTVASDNITPIDMAVTSDQSVTPDTVFPLNSTILKNITNTTYF